MSLAPKLRFKEFTDDWQIKKLGDIVENIGGTALEEYFDNSGTHKVISIGNYSVDGKYIDNKQRVRLNNRTATKILSKNDLAMVLNDKTTSGGIIGSTILIDKDDTYIYNQRTERLTPKKEVTASYLWTYINTVKFRKKIFSISQGGTQIYVNFPFVKKLQVAIPRKPEQEKIAGFLTIFDERIELAEKRIGLLKKYKKGMMKKIFTQKTHFKDKSGNNFPEWEEKRLGSLGRIVTGKTPGTSDKKNWDGDILFVTPSDINNNKYQYDTSRKVTAQSRMDILPKKSILYTCIASIGKMSLSVKPSVTNQQINTLVPSIDNDNEFLYYVLLWLTPKIISTQSNNTLPIINKTEFSKFKLNIPSLKEQEKIANFLTVLDDKIKLEEEKLTQTKNFKKSLLQRMFV